MASGYLAHGQELNKDEVPVYIQPTKHFHMPPPDAPMIMVGPGTGIAPFRAFLEEREIDGAKGKNWLFFGDQKKATDFLYEKQFTEMQAKGLLTKFDTAFSRDQAEKIYVQDRMRENARRVVEMAEGRRRLFLRLRRRQAHGEGRAPDADHHRAGTGRHDARSREGIHRGPIRQDREAVPQRRVLT